MKKNKDYIKMFSLLEESKDVLSIPFDVYTAASLGNCQAVTDALVDGSEDVINRPNRGGWTALMYAAYCGHTEAVKLLCSKGASVHSRTPAGCTPLMLASMCGHSTVVQALIKNGSLLELRDNKSWTAVFHAVSTSHTASLVPLIEAGANVNVCELVKGETPLLMAVRLQELSTVEVLLKAGADPNLADYSNTTPYALATRLHLTEIVSIIVSASSTIAFSTNGLTSSPVTPFDTSQHCRKKLEELLSGVGLSDYCALFEEQGVNLQVFLTLTDSDLKECGVSKLGPRRKMTALIDRWHSNAPLSAKQENAYADKLRLELSELKQQYTQAVQERNCLAKKLRQEKELRSSTESLVVDARAKLHDCHRSSTDVMHILVQLYHRVLYAGDEDTLKMHKDLKWEGGQNGSILSVDNVTNNFTIDNFYKLNNCNYFINTNDDIKAVDFDIPCDYKKRPPTLNVPKLGQPLKKCLQLMRHLVSLTNPNVSSNSTSSMAPDTEPFTTPPLEDSKHVDNTFNTGSFTGFPVPLKNTVTDAIISASEALKGNEIDSKSKYARLGIDRKNYCLISNGNTKLNEVGYENSNNSSSVTGTTIHSVTSTLKETDACTSSLSTLSSSGSSQASSPKCEMPLEPEVPLMIAPLQAFDEQFLAAELKTLTLSGKRGQDITEDNVKKRRGNELLYVK